MALDFDTYEFNKKRVNEQYEYLHQLSNRCSRGEISKQRYEELSLSAHTMLNIFKAKVAMANARGILVGKGIKLEKITNMADNINPDHYKAGGLEVIDILKAKLTPEEFQGFLKGNIIKYTLRARLKNGEEDIKKAEWYSRFLAGNDPRQ